MAELDSVIMAIIKGSSKDMTVSEVHHAITEEYGIKCSRDRAYSGLMSLVAYHFLDTEIVSGKCNGKGHRVFRLVSA